MLALFLSCGESAPPLPDVIVEESESESDDDKGDRYVNAASTSGPDTTITLFEKTHLYYPDHRTEEIGAPFPTGLFKKITLTYSLSCPDGNQCDHWDRNGSFLLIDRQGREIEFARFITPYRKGGTWSIDLTDLAPLLSGPRVVRAFINTYVGPVENAQYGHGWVLDARIDFEGGMPARIPRRVFALPFSGAVPYGDPALPTERQARYFFRKGAERAGLHLLITGHGQGNVDNCAEFCPKEHHVTIGDKRVARVVWRDDCKDNPVGNQYGTWTLSRAGWCPGADVRPWSVELGALSPGIQTLRYDVESYENTCRPDAERCGGCTLGRSCEYNGGLHTVPRWLVSGFLILFDP